MIAFEAHGVKGFKLITALIFRRFILSLEDDLVDANLGLPDFSQIFFP